MKFCSYVTGFEKRSPKTKIHWSEWYLKACDKDPSSGVSHYLFMESLWYGAVRPYYSVWPSVIPQFTKLSLDIEWKHIPKLPEPILLRFPEQSNLLPSASLFGWLPIQITKELVSFRPVMVSQMRDGIIGLLELSTEKYSTVEGALLEAEHDSTDEPEASLKYGKQDVTIEYRKTNIKEIEYSTLRCALTISLLAQDPSIIQPDVLADDRRRFDESTNPEERARLIAKARKRGIVGWRIGEEYETIPHFRRPHFALRHTGKGGVVPRIVPVKAAIVHRNRLTEVPTGYILPDGREVEP